jgi:hypothetical protein
MVTDTEAAGANFFIQRFNDAATTVLNVLSLNRLTGQVSMQANVANDFALTIENVGGSFTRRGFRVIAGNNNGQTTYMSFVTANGSQANFNFDLPTETASLDRRWSSKGIRTDSYTLANLPAAASRERDLVYCSNLTGGAEYIYSDGANWRRMSDRTIAD